jgi:hypothetical protein
MGTRELAEFNEVETAVGVPYHTSGMAFFSATCERIEGARLTLYDFFMDDVVNTLGAKADVVLHSTPGAETTLKTHYVSQRDVGRMDSDGLGEVRADVLDAGVEFKRGNLCVQPGITTVFGDDPEDDLILPFRSTLTIDPELLFFTRQFVGGSNSAYLRATYGFGNTFLYGMYVMTDHDADRGPATGNGALDQELDLMIRHDFSEHFYAAFLVGYGHRDNRRGISDSRAEDMRLFLGFSF